MNRQEDNEKKISDRVIKFRLLDKRSNTFIDNQKIWVMLNNDIERGYEVSTGRDSYDRPTFWKFRWERENDMSDELYNEIQDRYVLIRYIGLKDKNWKEIYEWDIIRHYWYTNKWIVKFWEYQRKRFETRDQQQLHIWYYGHPISNYDTKTEIEWNDSCISLLWGDTRNWIEVIWNLYLNPELLSA